MTYALELIARHANFGFYRLDNGVEIYAYDDKMYTHFNGQKRAVIDLSSEADLVEYADLIKKIHSSEESKLFSSKTSMRRKFFRAMVGSVVHLNEFLDRDDPIRIAAEKTKALIDARAWDEAFEIVRSENPNNEYTRNELIDAAERVFVGRKYHGENMDPEFISEMIDSIIPTSDVHSSNEYIGGMMLQVDNKIVGSFSIKLTDEFRDFVNLMSIYGANDPDKHFISIFRRDDNTLMMHLKYQYISGGYCISPLSKDLENQLFEKLDSVGLVMTMEEFEKKESEKISSKKAVEIQKKEMSHIEALMHIRYLDEDMKVVRQTKNLSADNYSKYKKMMEDMGGQWSRNKEAFVFKHSPAEKIAETIEAGSFKKDYNLGYFPTQGEIAKSIVKGLDLQDGDRVLEPSIGQGHLADEIKRQYPGVVLKGFELNPDNYDISVENHDVEFGNFLEKDPEDFEPFDAIIMNPPFEKKQDIDHVMHAFKFLKPGGQFRAIMSAGPLKNVDKKSVSFREFLESIGGSMIRNEEGSFKQSGTMVETISVSFKKPDLSHKLKM